MSISKSCYVQEKEQGCQVWLHLGRVVACGVGGSGIVILYIHKRQSRGCQVWLRLGKVVACGVGGLISC